MSYVDNAPLIEAWNTRVANLKAQFATLTDGTTTNVVIEDTPSNVLLSYMSVDGLTLDSNEQAPTITVDTPTIVEPTLEVIEGAGEGTVESDEDLEVPGTVEETVEDAGDGADPEQEESPEDKIESDEDEV